jgi:hypothetical protein
MRAASAEPDRPATRIPVIKGPNSRVTESATMKTTWCCAPNFSRELMPCIESVTPMATESIDTIGIALTPITIIWAKRGSARTR